MANVERLEQLRRVVRDAPDDQFNMREPTQCAWGWANRDSWFMENTDISRVALASSDRFFGLPWEDCVKLFCRTRATTTKDQVIANLDRVIAGEAACFYRSVEGCD